MRLCPHCGTENSPETTGCVHCGKVIKRFDKTIVGFSPKLGDAPFRGTMIGMAPPAVASPGSPPPASEVATDAPHPAAPLNARDLRKTMVGIGSPTPAGTLHSAPATKEEPDPNQFPDPPPAPERLPQRPARESGALRQLLPHHKTIMGVARPGIAPLNPGHVKAAPAPDSPRNTVPLPSPVEATGLPRPSTTQPLSPAVPTEPLTPAVPSERAVAKPGIPALAALAMVGAAGLFAAAAVVWLFYRGHGPIEARARALPDGTEQLELQCAACQDGSVVRLDAASATFRAQHALLPITRPLKVGENPMTLALLSARGKQSFVDVSVPVAFRVRGDTSGLDAPTPELRVLVSAIRGSVASVDGKPILFNAEGEGRLAIDVSAQLTGLDASVKPLERRVSYVVTPPDGSAQSGSITLQAGITPLVIDAPGGAVVLESSNFVLAGRTAKSGALTVSDRPITVDGAGRFAQMMNVSAPGETTITVRASSPDSAPRLFPLHVKRVDSLAREAERVRQRATSNYSLIAESPETKRGWAVALDGTVVDARTENYNTMIVLDVPLGCAHAPCLARIVYGAPYPTQRGDKLSAFGSLSGAVDGPLSGTHIPEVRADFLLLKASK